MNMQIRYLLLSFLLAVTAAACSASAAGAGAVYTRDINRDFEPVYREVYTGLEDAGFHVVYEAFISDALAKHAGEWGDDYNRNHYEVVRSIVICSPSYANRILNRDPRMLAVCPINVTVLYKQGVTTLLFVRLASIDRNSPAGDVLREMDNRILGVLRGVSAG